MQDLTISKNENHILPTFVSVRLDLVLRSHRSMARPDATRVRVLSRTPRITSQRQSIVKAMARASQGILVLGAATTLWQSRDLFARDVAEP